MRDQDGYVYVYSHDKTAHMNLPTGWSFPSPKGRSKDRVPTILRGSGRALNPVWTRDIFRRPVVFIHRNKCFRSAISYHRSLKRYL